MSVAIGANTPSFAKTWSIAEVHAPKMSKNTIKINTLNTKNVTCYKVV